MMKKLIPDLKNKGPELRAKAAKEFTYFKHERAIQPLIDALKDEVISVRRYAIGALRKIAIAHEHLKDNPVNKVLNDAVYNEDEFVRKIAKNYLKTRSKKK